MVDSKKDVAQFDRFIELDRCFRDVAEAVDAEQAAFLSYSAELLGEAPGFGWERLLASRLVVVLGEPGSGKTWELRHRVAAMKKRGVAAFFVRLDSLVDRPLHDALAPEDTAAFTKWRASRAVATFFLDSVDEAKFRRQTDFERALDSFVRGIGTSGVERTRVVLSARVYEWRVHTDKDVLLQRLTGAPQRKPTASGEDSTSTPTSEVSPEDQQLDVRVVQLEPLDRRRVELYAKSVGLADASTFIAALDQHHAWEFARRPIDVADLIRYWRDHGRLGTLTELIEFGLSKALRERPEREQNDPLSLKQARVGAECLGAAIHFCRRFDFVVPESVPPAAADGAIDASECLPPEWTAKMDKALLNRGIFDGATYGRIRFHHRRTAEYLAACWLNERMAEECPYPVLEDLLFANENDISLSHPSLRPVTAWLASLGDETWNRRIRNQLLKSSPETFLAHGDPQALSVDYRRSILHALISRYVGRQYLHLDADEAALSRLADADLATDIDALVGDTEVSADIRILLLRLIRHGRLRSCVDTLLAIVASPEESDRFKSYAVAAIREIGDNSTCERLAEIAQSFETIENTLCAQLCKALYPAVIDSSGLAALLRRSQEVRPFSVGLPWELTQHLEVELPGEQAADLLHQLVELCQEAPLRTSRAGESPVSQRFYWVRKVIPTVLLQLLRLPVLEEEKLSIAVEGLRLLDHLHDSSEFDTQTRSQLNGLLDNHPDVRRSYVWRKVDDWYRKHSDGQPSLYRIVRYGGVIELREADMEWLARDIRDGQSPAMCTTALHLAVDLWERFRWRRSIRVQIKRAVRQSPELRRIFRRNVVEGSWARLNAPLYRHGFDSWEHTVRRLVHRYRLWRRGAEYKMWLWRNLATMRRGEATDALAQLAYETCETQSRWGALDWHPLTGKHGRCIAHAAASGWKAAWRRFEPFLPHEKAEPSQTSRIIVGLSGINVGLGDGDFELRDLTPAEARLACRYAVSELNGFPDWLPRLAEHHPEPIRDVLVECVRGEWEIPEDRENVHGVVSALRYHGEGFAPLVGETMLEMLQARSPRNFRVLEDVLGVLLQWPSLPRGELAELAARQVPHHEASTPHFLLWMVIWIQLDAEPALAKLRDALNQMETPDAFMVEFCAGLTSRGMSRYPRIEGPDYLRPTCLQTLIPLVYGHVRVDDDTDRIGGGAYSPTSRDAAQDFRNGLFERLAQWPERGADMVLNKFAGDPLFTRHRDWVLHLLEQRAELAADASPWWPTDIPVFMRDHETDPRSDHDLFKIACRRFVSIKDDVERADTSARYDLHREDEESRLRDWIARQLSARAKGRYTVPPEEEIDRGEKPDLRIERPGLRPISIEIKKADNWTGPKLVERLVNQLVGQYLRAVDSNYGIYVLGYMGTKQSWETPETGVQLPLPEFVEYLRGIADELLHHRTDIDGLEIVSIDFSTPD